MFSIGKNLLFNVFHGRVVRYSTKREARMLQRMMEKHNRKMSNPVSNKVQKSNIPPILEQYNCNKRMSAINKIFMGHITSIMTTGKNSAKLTNAGIEVTRIQVDKAFKTLKVYWISSRNVEEVTELLKKTVGELQFEIYTLGFMGRWPEIQFIRDCFFERNMEVNRILDTLDLSEYKEQEEEPEPEQGMKHNVFGLKHDAIMGRIMAQISVNKTVELDAETVDHEPEVHSPTNGPLIKFDKKTFSKFIQSNIILKKKTKKRELRDSTVESDDEDDDYDYDDFDRDDFTNRMNRDEESSFADRSDYTGDRWK